MAKKMDSQALLENGRGGKFLSLASLKSLESRRIFLIFFWCEGGNYVKKKKKKVKLRKKKPLQVPLLCNYLTHGLPLSPLLSPFVRLLA